MVVVEEMGINSVCMISNEFLVLLKGKYIFKKHFYSPSVIICFKQNIHIFIISIVIPMGYVFIDNYEKDKTRVTLNPVT